VPNFGCQPYDTRKAAVSRFRVNGIVPSYDYTLADSPLGLRARDALAGG
jgi:hypothetical protein